MKVSAHDGFGKRVVTAEQTAGACNFPHNDKENAISKAAENNASRGEAFLGMHCAAEGLRQPAPCDVTRHTSHVTRHTSHVTRHTSHAMSRIICHESHVTSTL